jgi:hypothetical protein
VLKKKAVSNFQIKKEILEDALVIGTTFCSPTYGANIQLELDDILIVEQDCSSEMLISKKL